jgi:hypothetical protein
MKGKIQSFNEFNENLNISDKEIKCKWCDKSFKPTKKFQTCCTPEHDSKYNNHLANSSSESPWDKYTKDGYKDTYYQ